MGPPRDALHFYGLLGFARSRVHDLGKPADPEAKRISATRPAVPHRTVFKVLETGSHIFACAPYRSSDSTVPHDWRWGSPSRFRRPGLGAKWAFQGSRSRLTSPMQPRAGGHRCCRWRLGPRGYIYHRRCSRIDVGLCNPRQGAADRSWLRIYVRSTPQPCLGVFCPPPRAPHCGKSGRLLSLRISSRRSRRPRNMMLPILVASFRLHVVGIVAR